MINYKFKAIKDRKFSDGDLCFKKGEIYAVEDGHLTFECGWGTNVEETFKDFIERNETYGEFIKEIRDIDYSKEYNGGEIINMLRNKTLREGDELELLQKESGKKDSLVVGECIGNLSLRRKSDDHEIGNSFFTSSNTIFTIIPYVEKVDFLTAWKAYEEGNKVTSCRNYSYKNGVIYDKYGHALCNLNLDKEELEGEWVIEED